MSNRNILTNSKNSETIKQDKVIIECLKLLKGVEKKLQELLKQK